MQGMLHLLLWYWLLKEGRLLMGVIVIQVIKEEPELLSLLRERFWWPRMQVETMMAVKGCGRCKLFKGQDQQPELYTVEATEPMDLVHINFVSMETTIATQKKPVVQKVLVVIDHFTR